MIFFVVFPEFRFLKFFKKYKYFINKMYPKLIGIQISSYYEIRVSANYGTDFKIYSFEIRTRDCMADLAAGTLQIYRPPRLTPVLDLMYQHNPNPQGLFSPFPINFVGITQGKNNQDKDILNIIDQQIKNL